MQWFCLHTRPRSEAHVAAYCRTVLGLETYLPLLRQYRTIRRVRRLMVDPLFPRYLFCRFDPGESYRAVRYAPDTHDIVQFGGRPAIVADSLISDLREAQTGHATLEILPGPFHEGAAVTIKHGPLRGLTGMILRARDDSSRVELLLELLNEGTRVTVDRDLLELANAG